MATAGRTEALVLLHFLVFIWGFTGILGNEIRLDSISLVWWRVLIALAGIGIYARWSRLSLATSPGEWIRLALVGLITAAHWICFFHSIKISNISTALAVLSTTAFFVALVAPLIRKEPFRWYELGLGAMVIAGLVLIFRFEPQYHAGILFSLLAALCAALFSSFNAVLVTRHPPHLIAFHEMTGALAGISAYLLLQGSEALATPSLRDAALLLLLGLGATAFPYIAAIRVMKVLSPFTCAIAINLEPVYTIVLALAMYGESEFMSAPFYVGALIILAAVFLESWLKRRGRRAGQGS